MTSRASMFVGLCVWAVGATWSGPLYAELVGYWNFDGNVEDLSEHENHGQLVGATYSDNVPAVLGGGQSIDFKEDADHVLIEADESLDSEEFTLSMFVFDRGQMGAAERLTSRQSDTFETAAWAFENGEISYFAAVGGGWVNSDSVFAREEWQHIAFVADAANESMTIYLDGENVWESPDPWKVSPSGFMHIGDRWNDVEGFDGLIDNVALWNEVMDAESIEDLADGGCVICLPEGTIQGDFNEDGVLDSLDFAIMADNFNTRVDRDSAHSLGDFDLNTRVNLQDFIKFRMAIAGQGAAAAVPEPAAELLFAIVAIGLLAWRGRRPCCCQAFARSGPTPTAT